MMGEHVNQSKERYRHVYADGKLLGTKLGVHARYSTVTTDIPAAIATRIGAPNALDVLDVGCGTGHLIEYLASLGQDGLLLGLDLVGPPVADTGTQYLTGDAESLPFPSDTFDAVTCVHTLSHITNLPAAMTEAGRILKPGGRFLATANSLYSYPHTATYRRLIHELFGWGEAVFATTHVNLENLADILAPYWHRIDVHVLEGELRIPQTEFVDYFAANIPTWKHVPTADERDEILAYVQQWSTAEHGDDFIIEPKRVGLAVCLHG